MSRPQRGKYGSGHRKKKSKDYDRTAKAMAKAIEKERKTEAKTKGI